jgi:hypothetical protein
MEPYGSALTIYLPNQLKKDEIVEVTVQYETTDKCTAVQWLNPEQTFGGKYPFMFILSLGQVDQLGSRNVRRFMQGQCYLVKIPRP